MTAEASGAVCLIAPPFQTDGQWVTVPPSGYGGIQWSMVHLIDGLLKLGVRVTLLGAPGSQWPDTDVEVPDVAEPAEIRLWLARHRPTVIHDFANFSDLQDAVPPGSAYCRTWQLTSTPPGRGNTVFASEAQMHSVGVTDGRYIPLPVNTIRFRPADYKQDHLLFLGRVSAWKGAYEAAALARFLGRRLIVAGPVWEPDYRDRLAEFGDTVEFAGEVGGGRRDRLLAEAWALAVLSQPVPGPWGQPWCEPGAAVVAEAAASGTPIIATDNGCLPALMPGVGVVVSTGAEFTAQDAARVAALPSPATVRATAARRWNHVDIARSYLDVYRRCRNGERWV